MLGNEHSACKEYAENLRLARESAKTAAQNIADKVRFAGILETRTTKAEARVCKADEQLAAAALEVSTAKERIAAIDLQLAKVNEEVHVLTAAAPGTPSSDAMDSGPGSGEVGDFSAQALVAALQAKVQVDMGLGDSGVQDVLAPLMAALRQAQDALELRARAEAAGAAEAAAASAAAAVSGGAAARTAGPACPSLAGAAACSGNVAALRGAFERTCLGRSVDEADPRASPY